MANDEIARLTLGVPALQRRLEDMGFVQPEDLKAEIEGLRAQLARLLATPRRRGTTFESTDPRAYRRYLR